MDQSKATVLVLALLCVLAVLVTVASILILSGGKVYQKIPEKSRPRRWLVAIFFSYFVAFCLWFPAWLFYPGSIISRVLGFMFGAFTIFVAGWLVLGRVGAILLPIIAIAMAIKRALRVRMSSKDRTPD